MAGRFRPIPKAQEKERGVGPTINRGTQLSRKKDKVNDVSVGLMEVDGAIMYYFNDVIKPRIDDSGESVKVPVMYSNAERWKTAQVDGVIRDNKRQIILPVIIDFLNKDRFFEDFFHFELLNFRIGLN